MSRNTYNAHPDDFWEGIATEYREYVATHDGATRGVVQHMAKVHDVRVESVYTWVKWARRYGFLEPFTHRICHNCRQPVARNEEGKLLIMEVNAGDYEQVCIELDLPVAAGYFRRAAEALTRASELQNA